MIIRAAELSDRDAVIALWRAAGLTRPWNDPVADFDLALGSPASTVLLAEDGGTATGTIMAGFDGHRGWLYYLAVDPARGREGIGRTLVAAAEDWLRGRGCPKVELMVRRDNDAVTGFYAALGYEDQAVSVRGRWIDGRAGP